MSPRHSNDCLKIERLWRATSVVVSLWNRPLNLLNSNKNYCKYKLKFLLKTSLHTTVIYFPYYSGKWKSCQIFISNELDQTIFSRSVVHTLILCCSYTNTITRVTLNEIIAKYCTHYYCIKTLACNSLDNIMVNGQTVGITDV